jgi:phosphoribosylformylglycinamidine (FGAM) synthase-like enzyme
LQVCYGKKIGPPPKIELAHEIKVQDAVRDLIRAGLVKSAHDCSEGGLAVALAECCFNPKKLFGADVDISDTRITGDELEQATEHLFNESQSRIIISVEKANVDKAFESLESRSVPRNGPEFRWPVADLYDDWWNAIRRAVEQDESIPNL